jgi:AsmA-like C-terminal region/AsmA family
VKFPGSKRRVLVAAVAILLLLFLVRPGVSRLKVRIANSISRAIARPVEIGSVHLRFLPPGFDLENLVVDEDPEFGAEPTLRAAEVTAVVRLTSLLRGRLDISRLELTEPSLNLVRRADGRWNWETLLERTARMPLAPTAKSKSEPRPGFPYIEASSGRINFKAGREKKPYALLDADFALWQESENAWGVRLQAEPLRTDMNLNDAGVLRVNGTWQRAGTLRETPLQFSLEWNDVQLGQMTKLISGYDKGWRGAVRLDATLNGTPAAMQIGADASIDDFHRYDISSAGGMGLRAHCDARYSSVDDAAHEIFCSAPVGNGVISLHGDAGLPGVHRIDLSLDLESVPVSAAAQLAIRAKKNLPPDLVATGSVQGNFVVKEDGAGGQGARFEGQGEISDFRAQSASTKVQFSPGTLPFVLNSSAGTLKGRSIHHSAGELAQTMNGMRLEYGPFPVSLGRPASAQARGWLGRSGYSLTLRGEGEVSQTLRLASLLGLGAMKANAEGVAQMDLLVGGSWTNGVSETASGFSGPQVTGRVQLHNVRATMRGVNGPVEISSAELVLLPNEARVDKLNARAGDAHWTGSLSLPRDCGAPGACLVSFNVNTDQVALSGLHEWLRSPSSDRRWYQMLSAVSVPPSFLHNLRAAGKVSAGQVLIHNVVAKRVSASLDLEHSKLKISDLRASLLGGTYAGECQIDFATGSPVYTGNGILKGISLEQVADAMHDRWISGTASGSYQLKASGGDAATFWKSAEGGLQFDLRDGTLPHVALNGALNSDDPPLRFEQWQGRAHLRDGKIEIDKGKLIAPSDEYEIGGTASLGRALDFELIEGGAAKKALAASTVYSITGTVGEPHVAVIPAPETQAKLKP